jgi:hypothetical protein
VDPTVENKRGRIPLDFAKSIAEKRPEESERQVIVDFLRSWGSEQHEINGAAIITTAGQVPVYAGIDIVNLVLSLLDVDV